MHPFSPHKLSMWNEGTGSAHDPIAAVASAPGVGAVAVIRLSGIGCHGKLEPFLKSKGLLKAQSLNQWPERQVRLMGIHHPESKELLDEGLVVVFRKDRSFTGEESAELFIHGGPYVVQLVLKTLLNYGFRLADPGEFTKRAFLNGKLDLTAAEGIRELVEAQSHHQWLAARQLASGHLGVKIELLRQSLIEIFALVEAQVDFPDEEETATLAIEILDPKVLEVVAQINTLLKTYQSGSIASQGLKVVLFGEPNAGKSTLLNTLLNQERSLVTEVPGTTRDYLEERCLIEGRLIRLVDIAGIRESTDRVEQLGIEKAKEWASKADLLLFLVPIQNPKHKALVEEWLKEFNPPEFLKILTKSDLSSNHVGNQETGWLKLSCQTGEGLQELKTLIASTVDRWTGPLASESTFITNIRHKKALEDSLHNLNRYFEARQSKSSIEILAHELKHALLNLQSIIGSVSADDILSEIFGRFCIGK